MTSFYTFSNTMFLV